MKTAVARLQPRSPPSRKPIGLALQGGGSWGAYTWGVLDALLASRSVTIAQLSGTSAGAINAAIVASALATGSAAQARKEWGRFCFDLAILTWAALGGYCGGQWMGIWRIPIAGCMFS